MSKLHPENLRLLDSYPQSSIVEAAASTVDSLVRNKITSAREWSTRNDTSWYHDAYLLLPTWWIYGILSLYLRDIEQNFTVLQSKTALHCTLHNRSPVKYLSHAGHEGPHIYDIYAPLPPEAGPRCAHAWLNHISHTSHANSSSVHTYIHTYIHTYYIWIKVTIYRIINQTEQIQ